LKVIKNINNNVSVCLDDSGNEVIAFGKGLGFKKPPYEITNLNMITKTFYDVDPRYFGLLNLISEEIFEVSAKIVDYSILKIELPLSPNIVFTLADHIQFAIQRQKQGMNIKFTSQYDLEHFNAAEIEVGRFAVYLIKRRLKIELPNDEIYGIAMHFINAESIEKKSDTKFTTEEIIIQVIEIIEKFLNLKIEKSGFNYSRFASHLEYLFERNKKEEVLASKNLDMYQSFKKKFPEAYECAKKISCFFYENFYWKLEEEELIYLMLHINRLCTREDSVS